MRCYMKKISIILMFFYSFSAFSNDFNESNYPTSLNYFVDELNVYSQFSNVKYSPLTCGDFVCSTQIIINNKAIGGIMLHSKINAKNNVSATDVHLYHFITQKLSNAAVVCLENGQCSFFNSSQLDLAYEAYNNGQF